MSIEPITGRYLTVTIEAHHAAYISKRPGRDALSFACIRQGPIPVSGVT
jgi:hypothetical protein